MSKGLRCTTILLTVVLATGGCSGQAAPTKAQKALRQLSSEKKDERLNGITEAVDQFGKQK